MYWGDERGNDYGGNAARTSVLRADLHPVPACRRRGAEFKLNKEPQIAVAVCGDGGSSRPTSTQH